MQTWPFQIAFVVIVALTSLFLVVCDDDDDSGVVDDDAFDDDETADDDDNDDSVASAYTVWCDAQTGLCWQNPQKDAYDQEDVGLVPSEAFAYCESLVLEGYEDWRLPAIAELRTLIDGSIETEPGGLCGVVAGAATTDGESPSCLGGQPFEGPSVNGCYWQDDLEGTCDKIDPAVVGHPLETWAVNPAADDPEHWVAFVTFDTGAVGFNHSCSFGDVRCVRNMGDNATASCEHEGQPCEEFFPTKAHCEKDLTDQADTLRLTISLPEPLSQQPHQLMAFLYKTETDWYPPLAPPDGGTDTNQIIEPDIKFSQPLVVKIPGTTYYREELLEGDYQLYVQLQSEEKFPPIPVDGDYLWGQNQPPIRFPFDGENHRGKMRAMDILLEPVGCPAEQPIRCPDGTCVAEENQCLETECPEVPRDENVLTCRYESLFIEHNCADFPMTDGWTISSTDAFCKAQMGADASTVVVVQGDSCLVEKGGFGTSTRCAAMENDSRWWAYGAPEFVCQLFIGGTHETGPFCNEYNSVGRDR